MKDRSSLMPHVRKEEATVLVHPRSSVSLRVGCQSTRSPEEKSFGPIGVPSRRYGIDKSNTFYTCTDPRHFQVGPDHHLSVIHLPTDYLSKYTSN